MRPSSANSGLRGPPLNLCDIMQRGYLSQVHLLVSLGAKLEARDSTGRTPLMLTAYVQPEAWGVGVARLLIEQGVRMSPRDKYGMNALHHACVYERVSLASVLLNAPDFDLLQSDRFGNTALHYAAMSGNSALVRLLASYHRRFCHPLTKINRQGRTARDEAQRPGHYLCVAILDESASGSCGDTITKDGDIQSECESNPPVFITREESVSASEDVREVSIEESKTYEEVKTEPEGDKEPPKLSLRREGEEGGLFGTSDQEELSNNKHLLSPYHTPPASDRSSDLKTRSQNSSPRVRRSGIRRAHPACSGGLRRMSVGSSSSTRSATSASAHKLSLISVQSSSNNATTNNNTTTINNNAENGTDDGPNSTENKSSETASSSETLQRAKSPSLQSLKRNTGSVLSENTIILNNITNTTTNIVSEAVQIPSNIPRPLLRSPVGQSVLRKEPTKLSSVRSLPGQPQLRPNEKDPERIIHVASEHDFRNTREYVLKLTRMEFSPAHFDTDSLPVLVHPSPAVPQQEDDGARKASNATGSWRDNIRFLYRHLEYQCSPSWRDAAQPPAEPLMMIPQWGITSPSGDEVDEGKEKKTRRPSSSNRPTVSQLNDVSTSSNVKRKPSTNKQRKISAISPPSGLGRGEQGQGDNLTTSSSDSVSTGSKRKPDLGPNRP